MATTSYFSTNLNLLSNFGLYFLSPSSFPCITFFQIHLFLVCCISPIRKIADVNKKKILLPAKSRSQRYRAFNNKIIMSESLLIGWIWRGRATRESAAGMGVNKLYKILSHFFACETFNFFAHFYSRMPFWLVFRLKANFHNTHSMLVH